MLELNHNVKYQASICALSFYVLRNVVSAGDEA
jgi:hypothetical protein